MVSTRLSKRQRKSESADVPDITDKEEEYHHAIQKIDIPLELSRIRKPVFVGVPQKLFRVIYADPPWQYRSSNSLQGAAANQYPTVSIEQLMQFPIDQIADPECCALVMWVTAPQLEDALKLMNAWNFEYKTIFFTWVKTLPNGITPRMGLGHYTRSATELCLIGIRGRVSATLKHSSSVHQVIMAPLTRHSEKPLLAKQRIDEFFGANTEKIELFARCAPFTPRWTVWGNEAIDS